MHRQGRHTDQFSSAAAQQPAAAAASSSGSLLHLPAGPDRWSFLTQPPFSKFDSCLDPTSRTGFSRFDCPQRLHETPKSLASAMARMKLVAPGQRSNRPRAAWRFLSFLFILFFFFLTGLDALLRVRCSGRPLVICPFGSFRRACRRRQCCCCRCDSASALPVLGCVSMPPSVPIP